ncbi:MAG: hypothetical protein HQL42_20675 [Alphaproteobacteria bacterium]|nr:hypothetical protein [Alphaproteobacteria bacterium]
MAADALEVGGLDDAPLAPSTFAVLGDQPTGVVDADSAVGQRHRHAFADQPPRHRIGVGVDLDAAIGLH